VADGDDHDRRGAREQRLDLGGVERRAVAGDEHHALGGRAGRVISLETLPGLPEVRPGDDLASLLAGTGVELLPTDVLVIAHKILSKAEDRVVRLADVTPGERARELAASLRSEDGAGALVAAVDATI
jgi:hypothetical protein